MCSSDLYNNGIQQSKYSISTGTSIQVTDFNNGAVTGRTPKAKAIEERLQQYISTAKDLLIEISGKNITSCSDALKEIQANAKQRVTGKAPKGLKQTFISKLEHLSCESIIKAYIKEKQLSDTRIRRYVKIGEQLKAYFNNNVPSIDMITRSNMEGFKAWYIETYNSNVQNTITTFLKQVSAIFNYAIKKEYIQTSPIPKNFNNGFIEANKPILSISNMSAIQALNDNELTNTLQISKYSLILQFLTGMGHGDLRTLKIEHFNYNSNEKMYYIKKMRNKTRKYFTVYLSTAAKNAFDKLKELCGGTKYIFNLPCTNYACKQYKNIAEIAKVDINVGTYTARHSFAVHYMENDGNIEDLAEILGHCELETTRIYGKISQKRQAEKMIKLESLSIIHQLQPINKLKAVV